MKRIVALILTAALLIPSSMLAADAPAASQEIQPGEILKIDKCIDIALRINPSLSASRFNVDASEGKVGQAYSGYLPQASVTGGYNRQKPLSASSSSSTAGSSHSYDYYTGTASVTQLLYDFGKTPNQINIAKYNLDATKADLDATRAQTILNVKSSFYGLLKAQRALDVAKDTVKQYEQHLDQAKGFFEVGIKPKFDVTKAEVDLSNAKLSLITADNTLKIARVTLNNAMGITNAPDYRVEDALTYQTNKITLAAAIENAMQNRPEIIATGKRVRSADEAVSLAWKGYFPTISGNAAYTRASAHEANYKQDGWNAGVSINIPIFNGFLTYNQVKEADATYKAAQANFELLKQNVILEVQQAFLNLLAAADRIPTAELAQRQATENLEIATGRYQAGVGNPIEVTDAQVSYVNAKTAYIQALYDYNIAFASLEKSMGLK